MRCLATGAPCDCDINSAITCPPADPETVLSSNRGVREKEQALVDWLHWKLAQSVQREVSTEVSMVFLNGSKVSFRCRCGCNVFAAFSNSRYKCNACGELYQGS